MKKSMKIKIISAFIFILAFMISMPFVLYLKVLPTVVSNPKTTAYVSETFKDSLNVDLVIKKPVLNTSFSSIIKFSTDEISILKENNLLFSVKNLHTSIDLKDILFKKIIIRTFGAEYLFTDADKLMKIFPEQEQEVKKSDWYFDFFESELYLKKCNVIYYLDKATSLKINGDNLEITSSKNPKYVHFNLAFEIKKNDKILNISANDNDSVYIDNHKLFIKNFNLGINNSDIIINAAADKKNNFDMFLISKNFDVKNAVELLESNLVVPNGNEMLIFFKNINGDFDFNINLSNKGMNGDIILNKASMLILPLNNLPVTLNSGNIALTSNDITLKDFNGFYGKNKKNVMHFEGTVKDYTKSVDINITADALATNEFTKNYLSQLVGYPLELTGDSKTKLIIKSIYNKMDFIWLFKLAKGNDILIDGASLSPVDYDRALMADMHFENNILNIKTINYYIASVIDKNTRNIKPILSLSGNVDCSGNGFVQDFGFEIPKPLPSEFLNVLIGQKIFKKGTISGNLKIDNMGKVPVLKGNMKLEKVRIPSQRLSIKKAELTTNNNTINLDAFGRYKRSDYKLSGSILNELVFPVIVKNINLTVDNIDVQRILNSFNSQNTSAVTGLETAPASVITDSESDNENDDAVTFDTGLIIVEQCVLNVVKGVYKEINFGNIKANLTLDKNGILQVHSNKFDIAEGISTLKVFCDLKKHEYYLRLGIKEVNSDIIATSLLDLKKEITGKASGLIELNTDDSLKLNGIIRFAIKNGSIQKIGLVEYVLKFASLFRNPMAMMSPSTFFDLVNIPEGNFDKINGDLLIKNNIIEKLMIKSSAPQLSSFIIGRFDLENRDAILRIYTKFSNRNKGFTGVLRNLSLNSLANRVPLSSRNDSNYYAAELAQLPPIDADEKDCQVFLTKVDGDVERNNFLSSLKRIK